MARPVVAHRPEPKPTPTTETRCELIQAYKSALEPPPARERALQDSPAAWRGSKLGPYKPAIDRLLEEEGAGSLKRRSARAIREGLGIADVSEATVRAYVSWRRREIRHPDSPGCRPLRREGACDQDETARPIPSAAYRIEDLPRYMAARIAINPVTGCWEAGYAPNPNGYVAVGWRGERIMIHRLVYMLLVGPIPDGLQIDHVKAKGCRSRRCCNPAHLEPVTQLENVRRALKSTCKYGHQFDETNTYYTPNGRRICIKCVQRRNRKQSEQRAAREGRPLGVSPRDKTHCKNRHEFTEENTIVRPNGGGRDCRMCLRVRRNKWARKAREARKSQRNTATA